MEGRKERKAEGQREGGVFRALLVDKPPQNREVLPLSPDCRKAVVQWQAHGHLLSTSEPSSQMDAHSISQIRSSWDHKRRGSEVSHPGWVGKNGWTPSPKTPVPPLASGDCDVRRKHTFISSDNRFGVSCYGN